MRFKNFSWLLILGFLFATGCAPVVEDSTRPADTGTPAPPPPETVPDYVETYSPDPAYPAPDTQRQPVPSDTESSAAVTEPVSEPDWPARFDELVAEHLQAFQAPKVGETIVVTMAHSRREQEGVVEEVKSDELTLGIDLGSMTLFPEQVDEESRMRLFAQFYAEQHARAQAYREYAAWRAANRPIVARSAPVRTETARTETAPQNPSPLIAPPVDEVGALDPPPPRFRTEPEPPRNEQPDGRVSTVLAYIRRNAAKPDSLRIESWGTVRQLGPGYQVRVRYQLDGAENFGVTREDMIFFMHADGTVYRRAAYKGN